MKMVVGEALRPISAALDAVKSTTDSLNLKITAMETALSDHSDRITALEETCTRLQSENTQLMAKTEDLESRLRRNNL
jgi:chromosome segregation ATPase